MKDTNELKYVLYARKSSESDERQAMSIDGQLMEMKEKAKREKINIVETITESHSAKETGQRPQFNNLLDNIYKGKYNAIITWAPDRLSRNAGDLGRIVDLMDQGKLELINCHSQTFSNNPNEKFLLMILCSQAKLENDNRGINVKRGHRNKCMIGIRPGPAPIGYVNNMKANRISSVEFDKDRAPIVKEMFERVGYEGHSGRMVKKWLERIKFKTPRGCTMSLGRVYATLKNPFYYGEFHFGGHWYKGTYQPLISKQLFDKVQIQLETYPKQWNKQVFPFKSICKCGNCGSGITAEIKYRVLKSTKVNTHVYYHCCQSKDLDCREPYITEEELISQLISYLPQMRIDKRYLIKEFNDEIKRVNNMRKVIENSKYMGVELTPHRVSGVEKTNITETMIRNYLLHILQFGNPQERLRILEGIKSRFILSNRRIIKID
ncbi:MAG: recombinase family protein [Candidatus Dojkabacteria bacterium]